jgi:sulfur carrier protein ThiS
LQIKVTLHSILCELLPAENRGVATLDIVPGTTLADVSDRLGIKGRVIFTVNGKVVTESASRLHAGDDVQVYVSVHGG